MKKNYLHRNANYRILGIVRAGIFGLWLIIIFNAPLQHYALLPYESFSPWGIYRFVFSIIPNEIIQNILSYNVLTTFKYLLVTCCLFCFLGLRPWKILATCTAVMLLLFDGIVQGFYGYANHAQLGIQYCTIILAMFPCADGWSILGDTQQKREANMYKAPLLLCAFTLCLPYMFIGTHRVLNGGLELFTGDSILHYIAVRDLQHAEHNINSNPFILNYPSIFPAIKMGFLVTTVFEILTPFVLISHKFRYLWLVVIIPFHLLTFVTMNIFFWENLVLILLLLTKIPYWIDQLNQKRSYPIFFSHQISV